MEVTLNTLLQMRPLYLIKRTFDFGAMLECAYTSGTDDTQKLLVMQSEVSNLSKCDLENSC